MTCKLNKINFEKPWGKLNVPSNFSLESGRRIGEVWFEPNEYLPELLVKYIFTSDKLSVQVHPSDADTLAAGIGRQGKEECWVVIEAEPGAMLGIGFIKPVTTETIYKSAIDGTIEKLMRWHVVKPGDFYYIPAGTVHAIGAGITLLEVQQTSDTTYRLFDYGRPRELHLEQATSVALGDVYPPNLHKNLHPMRSGTFVEGPLFRLDQIAGLPEDSNWNRYEDKPLLAIPRHGSLQIGREKIFPGECAVAEFGAINFIENTSCLLAQSTTH